MPEFPRVHEYESVLSSDRVGLTLPEHAEPRITTRGTKKPRAGTWDRHCVLAVILSSLSVLSLSCLVFFLASFMFFYSSSYLFTTPQRSSHSQGALLPSPPYNYHSQLSPPLPSILSSALVPPLSMAQLLARM